MTEEEVEQQGPGQEWEREDKSQEWPSERLTGRIIKSGFPYLTPFFQKYKHPPVCTYGRDMWAMV